MAFQTRCRGIPHNAASLPDNTKCSMDQMIGCSCSAAGITVPRCVGAASGSDSSCRMIAQTFSTFTWCTPQSGLHGKHLFVRKTCAQCVCGTCMVVWDMTIPHSFGTGLAEVKGGLSIRCSQNFALIPTPLLRLAQHVQFALRLPLSGQLVLPCIRHTPY